MTGALASLGAALTMALIAAAAHAGEPLDRAGFLKGGHPLELGSLVETRAGVGVASKGEIDVERRRVGDQHTGRVSDTIAPVTRTRALPSTGPASRTTEVKLSPAFVSAVRGELKRLGVLK